MSQGGEHARVEISKQELWAALRDLSTALAREAEQMLKGQFKIATAYPALTITVDGVRHYAFLCAWHLVGVFSAGSTVFISYNDRGIKWFIKVELENIGDKLCPVSHPRVTQEKWRDSAPY